MTTDKKTLADAQPGGRVRLGDQAERARFEAWLATQHDQGSEHVTATVSATDDRYQSPVTSSMWSAWQAANAAREGGRINGWRVIDGIRVYSAYAHASILDDQQYVRYEDYLAALSAQPSPGGQGDAREIIEEFLQCAASGRPHGKLIAQAKDYLAARQPVYAQGCDELRARTEGERAAYREGLEEGKKFAARQPVGQEPARLSSQTVDGELSVASAIDQVLELFPSSGRAALQTLAGLFTHPTIYRYAAPPAQAVDLGTGVKAIASERERQLRAEGFSRDCDQQYREGELARAATAYVQLAAMDLQVGSRKHIASQEPPFFWPWALEWWKPVDARRDLVRAGALIAAQIDLIDSQAVGNG
ncbi:TPA: hypothetical protein ACKP5H_002658 [Stenotrophomonas maltophilia]